MKSDFDAQRRALLRSAALGSASALLPACVSAVDQSPPDASPPHAIRPVARAFVGVRNKAVGPEEWNLSNPAQVDGVSGREIEGYASSPSVDIGERIDFHVNVGTKQPNGLPADFEIDIFRLGWYDGVGGQRVANTVRLTGVAQPMPTADPVTGLIECNWAAQFSLVPNAHRDYPDRWKSGHYVAKLTELANGKQSYIKFIVRDDRRTPALLVQSSVTTDQCYNSWGGKSAYTTEPAVKLSFLRPYGEGTYGLGASFHWEYQLVRFLEREGYDVAYTTNVDIHRDPRQLLRSKAFVSAGHDEYWSHEMRDHVETARDKGVHLAFLGSNVCYWQIRFEPDSGTGSPHSTIVAYKDRAPKEDPYCQNPELRSRTTHLWRDADHLNNPENSLVGLMYYHNPVAGDMVVYAPEHWIFNKTGLRKGDVFKGLLGYEVDRIHDNGHTPTNLVRLCHSPIPVAQGSEWKPHSDMAIYRADSGAWVFASGSNQWVWGLDDCEQTPSLVDARVQQIMRNLFEEFARI